MHILKLDRPECLRASGRIILPAAAAYCLYWILGRGCCGSSEIIKSFPKAAFRDEKTTSSRSGARGDRIMFLFEQNRQMLFYSHQNLITKYS
jgi:hypothetical protein